MGAWRVAVLGTAICVCALFVSAARATLIDHSGSADPMNEGWDLYTYYGGSNAYPVSGDRGEDAWGVEKTDDNQELVYRYQLTSGQINQVENLGWSVSVRLRVVDANDNPDFGTSVHFAVGDTRYDLLFGSDADANPIVMLATDFTGNGLYPSGPSYTATGDGYHDYKLVYDHTAGSADLFVDGVERMSNFAGNANFSGSPDVFFGAAGNQGTGRAYFSQLSVSAPEPGSATLLLSGAVVAFLRRRRSR